MGEDVAQPVRHHRDPRFKKAERLQDGRPDVALRRCGPGTAGTFTAGDLGQVAQVVSLRRVEAERIGERVHHRHRGVAVTTLLDTGQVLDADAGSSSQIRASQTRRPAAASLRQSERLRLDAVALGPDEIPQRRTHAGSIWRRTSTAACSAWPSGGQPECGLVVTVTTA
ncbi:hypothetical protein GCM10023193_26030 [Planotetraspora kaengkrachanensis]|uniref:Uncharacterized protein n=1 Tax=Planotetraspora kaengkrachanensis TaxID=575193 RepID=A0A8J3M2W3_9ACTN|nr:hypothetical protein Pka01_14960 [Planotetraspora kaengkrachanensis]